MSDEEFGQGELRRCRRIVADVFALDVEFDGDNEGKKRTKSKKKNKSGGFQSFGKLRRRERLSDEKNSSIPPKQPNRYSYWYLKVKEPSDSDSTKVLDRDSALACST